MHNPVELTGIRRLDGVVVILETFHEVIAGSNPTVRILFFRNPDNFKMAKKGWSCNLQQNLTSSIFLYAPENPLSARIILWQALAQNLK